MKITVSGWPGAGSSSLSLILCNTLDIEHFRGGEVFRYIYKNLKFSNTGAQRIEAHNYVEPIFGPIFDEYIDSILTSEDKDKILVESDITSFRMGQLPKVLSIFLIADFTKRKKRMSVDSRSDDGEILKELDEDLKNRYYDLHGIDFLSLDQINSKHKLVIDNSNLTIAEELKLIYAELNKAGELDIDTADNLSSKAEETEKDFWERGKEAILDELKEKSSVKSPEQILQDIKNQFPEDVNNFPEELKILFN